MRHPSFPDQTMRANTRIREASTLTGCQRRDGQEVRRPDGRATGGAAHRDHDPRDLLRSRAPKHRAAAKRPSLSLPFALPRVRSWLACEPCRSRCLTRRRSWLDVVAGQRFRLVAASRCRNSAVRRDFASMVQPVELAPDIPHLKWRDRHQACAAGRSAIRNISKRSGFAVLHARRRPPTARAQRDCPRFKPSGTPRKTKFQMRPPAGVRATSRQANGRSERFPDAWPDHRRYPAAVHPRGPRYSR